MVKTAQLIAHGNSFVASDDDDFHLFFQTGMSQDQGCIIHIKHNDSHTTHVFLLVSGLNKIALKRLGIILRNNSNLENVSLIGLKGNQRHTASELWLSVGLQLNRSIKELTMQFFSIGGTAKLKIMDPFFTDNPRPENLSICHCSLGSTDIDFLSDWMMRRPADTLRKLNFSHNSMGNIDLDKLTMALIEKGGVKRLNLAVNHIGRNGVVSLAKLLTESKVSNMEELNLSANSIDSDDASNLINALADNNKLKTLNLEDNGRVCSGGWAFVLRRVMQSSYATAQAYQIQ